MAVSALAKQGEDKIIRQAYQRRKDEIYFYNKEREADRRRAEQAEFRAEQAELRAEQAETEIEKIRKENEKLLVQLANK